MQSYVVKVGDYMQVIAQRFQIPLYALLRANPQIPDKNKIYPGQVVYVPDTIGPPMLPPRPKPEPQPQPNTPASPAFVPWFDISLDPVADTAIIQEVYIRYREGTRDPSEGAGKVDWDNWEPWKCARQTKGTVLRQIGSAEGAPFKRDADERIMNFSLFPGGKIGPTSIMNMFQNRLIRAHFRVIEYRWSKQDPPQGPPFTPPSPAEAFVTYYNFNGFVKDPPATD